MSDGVKEMQTISSSLCKKCKYFYGLCGGDFKSNARNSGIMYPMCGYYVMTGKHRRDDFGEKKEPNSWLECDKFEHKNGSHGLRLEPMTFSKKGKELNAERRKRVEVPSDVKSICVCDNCGSNKFATTDSREINGQRIRTRMCKVCGTRFRTIEVAMDDYEKMTNVHKTIKNIPDYEKGVEDLADYIKKHFRIGANTIDDVVKEFKGQK